jgi:hypothetical protein
LKRDQVKGFKGLDQPSVRGLPDGAERGDAHPAEYAPTFGIFVASSVSAADSPGVVPAVLHFINSVWLGG